MMFGQRSQGWLFVVAAVFAVSRAAPAPADGYFVVKEIRDLEIISGKLPVDEIRSVVANSTNWSPGWSWRLRVRLEGPGEAYLSAAPFAGPERRLNPGETVVSSTGCWLAIRTPAPREITGTLFLPTGDNSREDVVRFRIPQGADGDGQRVAFLRTKWAHYLELCDQNLPGAAWFRFREHEAAKELGESRLPRETRNQLRQRFQLYGNPEDALAFFSGGRAVAENLQLDRELPATRAADPSVPVDSIPGITVREFDWTEKLRDASPQPDRLAALIPDDQYALFCSSFGAFVELLDRADREGTPLLYGVEDRAEDARSRERYEKQLCLPLNQLARILGPALIRSIAVTGGDPDFRTGTDVALLLEAKNTNAAPLRELILARAALAAQQVPQATRLDTQIEGLAVSGWRSPDRTVSCYVATIGESVVVTNSPAQIKRLMRVQQGAQPPLSKLPEYAFFRTRYPLDAAPESVLLVISDKTIRRWCGPRERIAAGRRTQAAAVMSDIQARHLTALVRGEKVTVPTKAEYYVPGADTFLVEPSGVRSEVYGTLGFQTPISELEFDKVTKAEAEAYARWRDGYQRYWTTFFDPIALQLTFTPNRLAADLTVMPLISASEYQTYINLSRGAKLRPDAGDPHPGTLAHLILALNPDSALLKQLSALGASFRIGNPLDWLGDHLAVFADADPIWQEAAAADDVDKFLQTKAHRLPVAVHIGVRNGLKLTAFLTGLRTFVEQSGPGMTIWEPKEFEGEPYVKISPTERARSEQDELRDLAVYYAASGKALVITPNEQLLHRALARQKKTGDARPPKPDEKSQAAPASSPPAAWLADNVGLHLEGQFLAALSPLYQVDFSRTMQGRAWAAIPILNEWKMLFPDRDPNEIHEQIWQRKLVCPGGGTYRWNAEAHTTESTEYGYPGQAKKGPPFGRHWGQVKAVDFGLTFEPEGLRARAAMEMSDK